MIAAISLAGASLSKRTSSNQRRSSTRPYGRVEDARQERPEAGVVLGLRRGQADRAVGPAVEGAEEGDDVRPMGRVAGQLDRGLDDLGPGVAEVDPLRAVDRRDARQPLAGLGIDRQVEVRRAEVDQLGRLLLDRRDDLGMAVPGRVDGDARREVEEQVAVDVLDGQPVAADRHDRVGPGQARRRPLLVVGHVRARLRTGDLGHQVRDGAGTGETRRSLGHGTPLDAVAGATTSPRTNRKYAEWILERSLADGYRAGGRIRENETASTTDPRWT